MKGGIDDLASRDVVHHIFIHVPDGDSGLLALFLPITPGALDLFVGLGGQRVGLEKARAQYG